MIKQYGRDLFLPEGDDYSKTEFDQHKEEMSAEGQEVLNRLRMEVQNARTGSLLSNARQSAGLDKKTGKETYLRTESGKKSEDKGKLSYKELLEMAVAKK